MKGEYLRKLGVVALLSSIQMGVAAQDGTGPKSRSAKAEGFTSARPQRPGAKRAVTPRKKPDYGFVSSQKGKKPKAKAQPNITELGVTVWKLRPPRSGEDGYLLPVSDSGSKQMWVAERTPPNVPFKLGDKLRIGVESSAVGYLYIIDRETYADGTLGPPELVFPESAEDDNSIGPGLLFDLPDQREDPPYYNYELRNTGRTALTGDRLTIIVSRRPITFLKTKSPDDPVLRSDAELIALEEGSDVEVFTRTDTEDSIYSKTEADASCGAKTRGIGREKSAGKACGARTLYRDDAPPQSLYRIKSYPGKPAVAFVKLLVKS